MLWPRLLRLAPAVTTSSQLLLVALLVWRQAPATELPVAAEGPPTSSGGEELPMEIAMTRPAPRDARAVAAAEPAVADASPPEAEEVPCAPGTPCRPVEVASWPFQHAGDTRSSEVREIDRYGCAEADEGGTEVWYRVTVETPGTVHAAIDEVFGDGIDVDLHLLTAPSGEACVARGNQAVAGTVAPGTYWLVVDTWVDPRGGALAGPYALTVAFVPEPD